MNDIPQQKNVVEKNATLQAGEGIHIGDNLTYIINEQKIVIPHLLTNNVPTNADHILGRETELQDIVKYLAQNKPTVLVNGIGGIGKTSVATKYVATYGHQYKHIAWLTVQSSLAEAFTNDSVLLKSLHIEQDVQQLIETQRLNDAFKWVVKKLNDLDNTLVVLDNANNSDDLIDHKNLFDTAKCHYLITSRTQPQEWTIVEIDHLPPHEAVNLFRQLAPSVLATDEDLKNLLSKLFYHTLLIELVAKAVENAGFSFSELQTMIETKFIHDESLNEDIVSKGKHGDNYNNEEKRTKIEEYIWLIFSNVKDLGDDAKQILRGMALLPVATPFDRAFLKEHLALFEVKDIVPNLSLLVEWGWLQKEGKGFKMHPLVAEVVVEHLGVNIGIIKKYARFLIDNISYDNTDPNQSFFETNTFTPRVERICKLFFYENNYEISFLLNNVSSIYHHLGFYQKAIEYCERSLEVSENLFDKIDLNILKCQSNLGWFYHLYGKHENACNILEKSLENGLKFLENDHPNIAIIQSHLALVLSDLGHYERAIDLLNTALASDLKKYGECHPQVAIKQSNLGTVYTKLKRNADAVMLFEKALKSDIKNFGIEHPNVATKQANLGNAYRELGNNRLSIEFLRKAIENGIKNFGDEHPKIAVWKSNLAIAYKELDQNKDAIRLLKEALEIKLKHFSKDHPEVAITQSNLAVILIKVGEFERATSLLELAIENGLTNYGGIHPEIAIRKSNLAAVYQNQSQYELATPLLEEALKIDLAFLDKKHLKIAYRQRALAFNYIEIGKLPEAIELLESTYMIFYENLGTEHPDTIELKNFA